MTQVKRTDEFLKKYKCVNKSVSKKFITIIITAFLFSCNSSEDNPTPNPTNLDLEFEYQLIWSDEFEGNSVNLDNWTFKIWNAGHLNNEWQQYVENTDNYKVENGNLEITAIQTGNNEFGGYTSTRLSSKNKQEFKYGRIEFRAKMPSGTGTWSALWMLGSNIDDVSWPKCGEIDILEYVGYQPNKVHTNIHTENDFGATTAYRMHTLNTTEEEFHIYGMIWTNNKIKFYIDDKENIVNTYSPSNQTPQNWSFSQDFYFIMNFAVGGIWGGLQGVDGDIWPQTMYVDYVRVYQLRLVE